jgi:hypothetical protein
MNSKCEKFSDGRTDNERSVVTFLFLFPLTDNTDGAAVDKVQQQHLFISNLHRLTLG